MSNRRILVVEDEEAIAEAVGARLVSEGYDVRIVHDGPEAIRASAAERPDLVVLDLMLPGMDGLEVCRELQRDQWIPVLMLTARTDEADKVAGFAVGADDYLTKPFSLRELAVRVRAILRRMERIQGLRSGEAMTRFDLTVDPARRRVTKGDEEVPLTPLEFEILHTLIRNPGVVLGRDELMERVWGYRDYAGGRVVDSHVARIRRKLADDAGEPRYIRTVHGVGYAFLEDGDARDGHR
jgi:DNA-binding response OmpR family regulator